MQRQLAIKLGQVSRDPRAADRPAARQGAVSGFARHQGLLVELPWLNFKNAPDDLPDLIEWLCRKRCGGIKYDLRSTGLTSAELEE